MAFLPLARGCPAGSVAPWSTRQRRRENGTGRQRTASREAGSGGPRTTLRRVGWLALLVVWVLWGSTYFAIRVGVETLPPLLMAGTRYVMAGLLMFPFALRSGGPELRAADRPRASGWWSALLVGTLLLAGGNGGVSVGERSVPSGLAALLVATVPLWLILIDRILNGARIGRLAMAGLVAGVIGVGFLAGPFGGSTGHAGAGHGAHRWFARDRHRDHSYSQRQLGVRHDRRPGGCRSVPAVAGHIDADARRWGGAARGGRRDRGIRRVRRVARLGRLVAGPGVPHRTGLDHRVQRLRGGRAPPADGDRRPPMPTSTRSSPSSSALPCWARP